MHSQFEVPSSHGAVATQLAEAIRLMRADDALAAALLAERTVAAAGLATEALGTIEDNVALGQARALRILESEAGVLLARSERRNDHLDHAVRAGRDAVRAARAARDPASECLARAEYSHVLTIIGQHDDALREAQLALQVALRAGQPRLEAAAYEALAVVNWRLQHAQACLDLCQRALPLALGAGDAELCAMIHGAFAAAENGLADETLAAAGDAEALAHFSRSAEHGRECARWWAVVGEAYNIDMGHNAEAIALIGLGDLAGARARLEANLGRASASMSRRVLALLNLAEVDLREGDFGGAITRLLHALDGAERIKLPLYTSHCHRLLSEAHEKLGDLARALASHKRYHDTHVAFTSATAQERARAVGVALEFEQAQAGAEAQRQRADRLESSNAALAVAAERLARDSQQDALTGIANRRRFDEVLRENFAGRDIARPYSLALIDVDHFKRVNDGFSHLVGDQVLRRIGALLAHSCRRVDLAARYGGEEFVLLLDELDREAASAVCERVRRSIETEDWSVIDSRLRVTVSIGLAHLGETSALDETQALLALADSRLYEAKHAGRNRLVGAPG